MSRKVLFLDLDGTVAFSKKGLVTPEDVGDVAVYPSVKSKLLRFKLNNYLLIGVSNKGGIAFGYYSHSDVKKIHSRINFLLGNLFDKIFYSGKHPGGSVESEKYDPIQTRKPLPGMALLAQNWVFENYGDSIDFKNSIMVGNEDTDKFFALNARIGKFYWAEDFFNLKTFKTVGSVYFINRL